MKLQQQKHVINRAKFCFIISNEKFQFSIFQVTFFFLQNSFLTFDRYRKNVLCFLTTSELQGKEDARNVLFIFKQEMQMQITITTITKTILKEERINERESDILMFKQKQRNYYFFTKNTSFKT